MSKMDGLRALREARYADERKAGASKPAAPARIAQPRVEPAPDAPAPVTEAQAAEALCGHRSMNGRTCTREHGHAAKSHRYS
jgi:hypothetical protein